MQFSQILYEMTELKFSRKTFKSHPAKLENEKKNHNSSVTFDSAKNPKKLSEKIKQINFCCSLLFANWTENRNYIPQN